MPGRGLLSPSASATMLKSPSNGSLSSSDEESLTDVSLASYATTLTSCSLWSAASISKFKPRRASKRTKRNASVVAALMALFIFRSAIRSCMPSEGTTWHRGSGSPDHDLPPGMNQTHNASALVDPADNRGRRLLADHFSNKLIQDDEMTTLAPMPDLVTLEDLTIMDGRRRLKHMDYAHKLAPEDLKKLHRHKDKANMVSYHDPRSVQAREASPLTEYKLNPLIRPGGYPWHRWARPNDGSYPLNSTKFVGILSRLGRGEDDLSTVTPNNYTVGGVPLTPDVIRLGPKVRPYIIRGGRVLRPGGRTGMFVTLVERAVEMAASIPEADRTPRIKLLVEGELPLVFDANDYPWCGDDLVPIFRLNAIKDADTCRHSWPAMSLTYFQDPTNVQLAESPYKWDEMMAAWDRKYPWEKKIPKVVWRGRITGYTHRDGERPRQQLVRYAQGYKEIMDVKPSTQRSKMAQDDFQKYRAILDIDGNAWSARLGKLLCFNSVVIKVEPTYVGYWEKEIEPWVHYIPVEPDFSDLEKTVRYVMDSENAEQMQRIVRNGQQFCRTKLTMEQYTVDILWTLLAYVELLDGSPDFFNVWRKDRNAHRMEGQKMAPWQPQAAHAQ